MAGVAVLALGAAFALWKIHSYDSMTNRVNPF